MNYAFAGLITGIVGVLLAAYFYMWVNKRPEGTEEMRKIASYIREGAGAFLRREYKTLMVYLIIMFVILLVTGVIFSNYGLDYRTAFTFVFGGLLSAFAGYFGMKAATLANVRTANALKKGVPEGLKVAFTGGAVMGLSVASLGLLGVSIAYLVFSKETTKLPVILFGFSFGASSIALFARVGGGIYTKAADVGADIVGKVEAGIPEDDPRNPAVIADNVGDNVGDVAGMGADLYESYVGSVIATIALGVVLGVKEYAEFAILVAAVGIIASIIGILVTANYKGENVFRALNLGTIVSVFLTALIAGIIAYLILPNAIRTDPVSKADVTFTWYRAFISLILGLLAGIIIGFSTQYYTSDQYKPTREVAKGATTGPAIDILAGMAVGMFSTIIPMISIAIVMIAVYHLIGIYGISLAAVGMLSTLAMTMSMDAYGPIADNAAGISEMASLGKDIREKAESLDAVGNTTAAIGKGFAIGSAALTALAFFANYSNYLAGENISITQPSIVAGIFLGALMPFVFSSMAIKAVERAAMEMVNEIRRQFREIPGILEGKVKPDYARCVDISTKAALKEMITPTISAILAPIIVGITPFLGREAVGGFIIGATASGFLLAVYMANAGGTWDNAKKYIEKGNLGGKGSDAHKAAVVGDTVGDPLKDTAGPSLNILIKLMSVVALLFAPIFF
ncbi:MAG TPA: sodium-translocating pyrophosphatase [Euryarchaeota archaeon]|nr:sodium-translocating pyrophosphatase [Euryarchaeota archaeon]